MNDEVKPSVEDKTEIAAEEKAIESIVDRVQKAVPWLTEYGDVGTAFVIGFAVGAFIF